MNVTIEDVIVFLNTYGENGHYSKEDAEETIKLLGFNLEELR